MSQRVIKNIIRDGMLVEFIIILALIVSFMACTMIRFFNAKLSENKIKSINIKLEKQKEIREE